MAYDWSKLQHSLPLVYPYADVICLSIDKSRKSWSGTPYIFDDAAFRSWFQHADPQNKIYLYEDDFSLPDLTAMQNDSRQRNLMAERLGVGGWHIQIDSDEYFPDFKMFTDYLRQINSNPTSLEKPLNVHVFLYDLYKKVEGGYLIINNRKNRPFSAPFATTRPDYWSARQNGHFNLMSPFYVLHETWSRSEEELRFKLANWGHSAIELENEDIRESYIKLWKAIDRYNYQFVRDFHFSIPHCWESLQFIAANNIHELLQNFQPDLNVSKLELALHNNRVAGKFKQLVSGLSKRKA